MRHPFRDAVPAAGLFTFLLAWGVLALLSAASAGTEHPALEGDMAVPCSECHSDLLEGEVVHPPAGEGDCETCHEFTPAGEEWSVSLMAPEEEICLMCHENPAEAEDADSIHPPVAEAMCVFCHNPHSSGRKGLFRDEGNELCLECHGDQQEELERNSTHGVIGELGCPACHDPHASANRRLLLASGNDLCLECHLGSSRSHPLDPTGAVLLFGSRVVEVEYFDRMPKLNLVPDNLLGHPVSKHPIAAENDPRRPGEPFGCGSCHEPHGSERSRLLVGGEGFGLCRQCHEK